MTYQEQMEKMYKDRLEAKPAFFSYKEMIRRYLGSQLVTDREAIIEALSELMNELKQQ